MDGDDAANKEDRCEACGEEFGTTARFCRHCGAERSAPLTRAKADAPTEAHAAASPPAGADAAATTPPGALGADAATGHPPSPAEDRPQGRPAQPPVGQPPAQAPHPGYPTPPPGYPLPPGYPVPPGYPTPPPGYPLQHSYVPAPLAAAPQSGVSVGWLIGGIAGAVLVIAAIGIGIYFAASGSSGGQTRLLSAPVLPVATAASSQNEPTPSQPSPSSHPHAQPSPSLPPSVAAATHATPTGLSGITEQHAVASTIQRHFSLIRQHRFAEAYALLAPSLQNGESTWISAHQSDGIYSVNVAVNAMVHSPSSATATIAKMTTLDNHGCKHWSGSWDMTKINGQWRISKSNLSPSAC
jgi:hypothetical protein